MITILTIISMLVIAAYTAAVCVKTKGVPYSISATFYAIEHKGWFRFTMWACPMVLMPAILEVSKPGTEFLAYLALAGMIVVGCFPNYKADKFQHRGHIAGATMAILFSQIWATLNFWPMLFVWLAYVSYTALSIAKEKEGTFWYKFYQSKPMFWIEIAALLSTYLGILFLL
jgi:hypothetical protein